MHTNFESLPLLCGAVEERRLIKCDSPLASTIDFRVFAHCNGEVKLDITIFVFPGELNGQICLDPVDDMWTCGAEVAALPLLDLAFAICCIQTTRALLGPEFDIISYRSDRARGINMIICPLVGTGWGYKLRLNLIHGGCATSSAPGGQRGKSNHLEKLANEIFANWVQKFTQK